MEVLVRNFDVVHLQKDTQELMVMRKKDLRIELLRIFGIDLKKHFQLATLQCRAIFHVNIMPYLKDITSSVSIVKISLAGCTNGFESNILKYSNLT